MINFSQIIIKRAIMHQINAKLPSQEHATIDEVRNLFSLTPGVQETIKQRLVEAAGKASRAFELEVGTIGEDTFYRYANQIKALTDSEFINASIDIALKLADSQKRNNIPGGYLIILDCANPSSTLGIYIVIKAELHQALKYERNTTPGTVPNIELLSEVFLSPSQKLFKIGILVERNSVDNTKTHPNNTFIAYLFDDQFRSDSKPAEYFYKDFLGFSIDRNSKIQSKRVE